MTARIVVQSVHKAGNDPEENEDRASYISEGSEFRAAIADGATESSFSDLWADALVENSLRHSRLTVDVWSAALASWHAALPPSTDLPWYAHEKLADGSHAAIASIRLRQGRSRYRWNASAVGDCELFILKGGAELRLLRALPLATAADFGFHPTLVPTQSERWPLLRVDKWTGALRAPFEIWLVTDALAQSCLASLERGVQPWSEWVVASQSPAQFSQLVDKTRSLGTMRNDDVTMVRIWAV